MSFESHGGCCLSLSWNASIVSKHNGVTHLPKHVYVVQCVFLKNLFISYHETIMRIGREDIADYLNYPKAM